MRTMAMHRIIREGAEVLNGHFPILEGRFFNKIHIERTIDEAYYPGLERSILENRNTDQVVRRVYPRRADGRILPMVTVAQLWLWRADNVVVSAFASHPHFNGDANDPFTVNDSWRPNVPWNESPDLLVLQLLAARINAFGRTYQVGGVQLPDDLRSVEFPPVLNIFETAVVMTLDNVNSYMRSQGAPKVDTLKEAAFVHIISDIRSEIVMIQDVLDQQKAVLSDLRKQCSSELQYPSAPSTGQSSAGLGHQAASDTDHQGPAGGSQKDWASWDQWKRQHGFHVLLNTIESYRKRTEKIDRDAERTEQVILNMLDVKRTAASHAQASASDDIARASIQEATDSKRLSLLVIGFTVMTIHFPPLSFVASLFAMDIDTLASLKYTPGARPGQNTGTVNSSNSADKPDEVYPGGKMAGIFSKSFTYRLCASR